MELRARSGERGTQTISIRPGSLSAEDALILSEKLKAHAASRDIIYVLRFAHYIKRGQKEPAQVALELVNEKLAEAIVESARERRQLASQAIDIDLQEGLDLRRELEPIRGMTECQRAVQSGEFVPLTGKDFCIVWDSGILELLPSPSKFLTGAARLAAVKSLSRLPRDQLRKVPRTAAILAKHEARRQALQQEILRRAEREDFLAKQLLELQWNVVVEFSKSN